MTAKKLLVRLLLLAFRALRVFLIWLALLIATFKAFGPHTPTDRYILAGLAVVIDLALEQGVRLLFAMYRTHRERAVHG